MNDSPGDLMTAGRDKALKTIAIWASLFVYFGFICYSGAHNWRLLQSGVAPELRIWAAVGVIALEITALALPLALHFWCHAPLQRFLAFGFYAVDLLLIGANMILDYAAVTANLANLPAWLTFYLWFIVPACPVICGLGWSLLWLTDPSQRERAMVETLRAATRESLMARIAQQARAADLTKDVDKAAAIMARDIISETLGISLARTSPKNTIDAKAKEPLQPGNGKVVYNAEVESIEQANQKNDHRGAP